MTHSPYRQLLLYSHRCSYVYLINALKNKKYISTECVERVRRSSLRFQSTVYELLKMTRVESFC